MGAFEQPWKTLTGVPAVDFATKRYTAVTYDTAGKVVTPAVGKNIIGVIQEPNNVDEPAQVVAQGFSFAIFGGTVATGADVEVGADGTFVTATTGTVVGIAAVGGVAGDIGTVLLK